MWIGNSATTFGKFFIAGFNWENEKFLIWENSKFNVVFGTWQTALIELLEVFVVWCAKWVACYDWKSVSNFMDPLFCQKRGVIEKIVLFYIKTFNP